MTTETMESTQSPEEVKAPTLEELQNALAEATKAYEEADHAASEIRFDRKATMDDVDAANGKRRQAKAAMERAQRAVDKFEDDAKLEALSGLTQGLKDIVAQYLDGKADEISTHGLKGLNVSIDFTPESGRTISVTRPGSRVSSPSSGGGAPRSTSTFEGMSASEFIKARGKDGGLSDEQVEKRSQDKNNVMHYARVLANKLSIQEVKASK